MRLILTLQTHVRFNLLFIVSVSRGTKVPRENYYVKKNFQLFLTLANVSVRAKIDHKDNFVQLQMRTRCLKGEARVKIQFRRTVETRDRLGEARTTR